MIYFFVQIKISYYRFNRQELLQKASDRYHNCGGEKKAAKYYIANKDVIKENENNNYKNLSGEEKRVKREYERNRYTNMKEKNKLK